MNNRIEYDYVVVIELETATEGVNIDKYDRKNNNGNVYRKLKAWRKIGFCIVAGFTKGQARNLI